MSTAAVCVMVVEDDRELRELECELLEEEGYEVVPLADGREALTFLRGRSHGMVVLLDLMMPNMDGLELLDAIEAADDMPPLSIVLATVSDPPPLPDHVVWARKPLHLTELRALVRHACERLTQRTASIH